MAVDMGSDDDGGVRCLIGVLVIALIALTLPVGGCCVLVTSASHACCRTQCFTAASSATMVKAPIALAFSIAPVRIRVVAVVTHQPSCVVASTHFVESSAPPPLRI